MDIMNRYSDIILTTEDGQFQLILDVGFFGAGRYAKNLHNHTAYELFFVTRGKMDIVCSDQTVTLTENMMLVVPPKQLHYAWSEDPKLQRYVLMFRAPELSEESLFHRIFHAMKPILFQNAETVRDAFLRLSRYYTDVPPVCNGLMASCFYEILYLLKKEMLVPALPEMCNGDAPSLRSSNFDYEYRNYVIDHYINRNFFTHISIKALAEMLYMSERHINRIVHANYGQSFNERVTYLRMQNAQKLLSETDMTAKAIAAAVGYQSIYGFYLSFEKMFGMTPKEFRRQYCQSQTQSEENAKKGLQFP